MSSDTSIRKMLKRLGFREDAATYLTGTCGIDSLEEIAYLDGVDDMGTMVKGITSLGETVTMAPWATAVTSRKNGIPVSIRPVANMKLCVYYLKHMERVQRKPTVNTINLDLFRSYCDKEKHKVSVKKTAEEPVINDKDWTRTLGTIKEYLTSQYGGTGDTLDYVLMPDIEVKPEAEDPVDGYDTVDQDMTAREPPTV
jgi:hypothetical protein